MSIKVKVERSEQSGAREYPWIGEYAGTVVLFSGPRDGVVLANLDPTCSSVPGHYACNWHEASFVEFIGTVTLSN